MSDFILIPKNVLRYGLSDILINKSKIVTMIEKSERDIPMLELCMGVDVPLRISFNSEEAREYFFNFIGELCKPMKAEEVPAEFASKTEKKRRSNRD